MADNDKKSGAQSELGNLFVDIGSSGLGTLVKGLNTLNASFLLTKKGAENFIKPIVNMTKQSIKGAIGISQLGASLGTTAVDAYKLKTFFDIKNLSGLEGDLGNISKTLTDVSMGVAGISGDMAYAFNQLGLNWQDYNGSLESTIQLIKDVQKATEGLDRTEARSYLNKLGLQDQWLYAFQRGDFNIDEFKTFITDEDVQTILNGAEAMNKLRIETDQLKMKLAARGIEKTGAVDAINTVTDIVNDAVSEEGRDKLKGTAKKIPDKNNPYNIFTPLGNKHPILNLLSNTSKLTPGGWIYSGIASFYNTYKDNNINANNKSNNNVPKIQLDYTNIPENNTDISNPNNLINTQPLNISDGSMSIPPNTTISYNIEINNSNNITGNNATEIADRVAALTTDDIKYSQYQAHNLPNV